MVKIRWWTVLVLCALGATIEAQESNSLVPLNHLSAIVDSEIAKEIAASGFLREFSNFTIDTVASGSESWRGLYLRGRSTYLELFEASDLPGPPEERRLGRVSIALGGDPPGTLDRLDARMRAAGLATERRTRTAPIDGREVDWFVRTRVDVSAHGFAAAEFFYVRAMEYAPGFFEAAGKEPAEGEFDIVSRERYLSDAYADKLMKDIAAIAVSIPRSEFTLAAPLLVAAGFELTWNERGVVVSSPDFEMNIRLDGDEPAGLRQIEFSLNRTVTEPRTEQIGNSRLTVGPGARAVWLFPPSARGM
jgi:Family of unknown function (DUF5829)